MDVKVGAKTYGPDASKEKIAKQDASYSGNKVEIELKMMLKCDPWNATGTIKKRIFGNFPISL